MVRNYKRKTDRGNWPEEAMRNAISVVLEGKMGYHLAAKLYSVPQSTLERKVKIARENRSTIQEVKVPLGPKSSVFSHKEESDLVRYLQFMESKLFGLTTDDVKSLVFQLATKNMKDHPFSEKGKAGKDWFRNFLKRHPDLSVARCGNAVFNKGSVDRFYKSLQDVYEEYQLIPDRIYNCDEIAVGASTVSAERGQMITSEICFSASGRYLPPMLVFPRGEMCPEERELPSACAWCAYSESGWMTSELFLQWFRKFVTLSQSSKDEPVLLLLDGQCIHTKNLQVIDEAEKNGVVLLSFPPHTTHKLQPLDTVFMKTLSWYYDEAVSSWVSSNPGGALAAAQSAEMFSQGFAMAADPSPAIESFRECGIWPLDPTLLTEADFMTPVVNDIPLSEPPDLPVIVKIKSEAMEPEVLPSQSLDTKERSNESQPGCSYWSCQEMATETKGDSSIDLNCLGKTVSLDVTQPNPVSRKISN